VLAQSYANSEAPCIGRWAALNAGLPLQVPGIAGNASQQNDGAAACLIVAEEAAESLDLHPIAALVGWAASGCGPARMGIGPVPAVAKLFARTGLGFDDLDLIELNDAFAV